MMHDEKPTSILFEVGFLYQAAHVSLEVWWRIAIAAIAQKNAIAIALLAIF
ncbi:MAG: hypothetical protein WA984_08540 [Phormidesmis sp.]